VHSDAYKQLVQDLDELGEDLLMLIQIDKGVPLSPEAVVRYMVVHGRGLGDFGTFTSTEIHAYFGGGDNPAWFDLHLSPGHRILYTDRSWTYSSRSAAMRSAVEQADV
jgi:hypothetical protein